MLTSSRFSLICSGFTSPIRLATGVRFYRTALPFCYEGVTFLRFKEMLVIAWGRYYNTHVLTPTRSTSLALKMIAPMSCLLEKQLGQELKVMGLGPKPRHASSVRLREAKGKASARERKNRVFCVTVA